MNPNPAIRFLCFASDCYYPGANMINCFAKAATLEEAKELILAKKKYDFMDIYDTWTGESWEFDDYSKTFKKGE